MSLLLGDCLERMKDIDDECIDLIYLDPPFFTQKEQTLKPRDNSKQYSFDDKWDSIDSYRIYMEERLRECFRVLKRTGSIFLHCDKSASHHLRIALDNTFGSNNFQSEIVWYYKRWSNSKKGLLNNHQTIYFYSKTADFKFNTMYTGYSLTTNIDQILQDRVRNEHGKSEYKKDEHGEVILGKAKKGVPISDVWEIPFLNPKAAERVGYPTQKPILLLERIINICTDEGDTVLDPFVGSGTTLVAAKLLNRQFVGIDAKQDALELTEKRLDNPVRTNSYLLEKGKDSYKNLTDEELNILETIDAVPVQRNKGIDGFLSEYHNDKPISVRIQKKNESLSEAKQKLRNASKKKQCSLMILIRTQRNDLYDELLIEEENDSTLLVVDSYDIQIKNWIKSK